MTPLLKQIQTSYKNDDIKKGKKMTSRTGQIKVDTADIFPIIKKWLYSEHDIFLRELISNATDAITKRATLARTRNEEIPNGQIDVRVNKTNKTIIITDNGLGMSEAEVEKYLAQLAFSGAAEFVKNLEDQGAGETTHDIIGKFRLGFYSAFMVSTKVEVETLSMDKDSIPTKWICEGETDYVFETSDRKEVGTTITLHINEESVEFLSSWKLNETLKNFCDFMPYKIGVLDEEAKPIYPKKEDGTDDTDKDPTPVAATVINETNPLWKKDPKECTDEEYINFYKKLYPMDSEPLFWVHLKVDHPFTLEGILFFPKLNPLKPFNESNIRLYSKQVFVSESVKSIIPEFLSLLKGTIDSADIPLNVSRSSLQGDPNVKRVSNYIVKKVADALKVLSRKDREKYESIWADIGLFVKYGVVSDTKFDDLMRDQVIFKNADGKFNTLSEYKEIVPEQYKEKMKDLVLYFEKGKSDRLLRSQLLDLGIPTVETDDHIDPHFMQHVETQKKGDETVRFSSIDSEYSNIIESENTDENDIKIKELFAKYLVPAPKEGETANPMMAEGLSEVEIVKVSNSKSPAYLKVDEQMKRFQKMTQSMGNAQSSFPVKKTLVINPANALIMNALKIHEKGNSEQLVSKICHHVEDLASISSEGLPDENRELFVERSQQLIEELTNLAL
ncbi:MAG: molecular chaperone HtpG [Bacteriovoracaceae bacterium]|nr:molecular chaperone HtpG [Bacteriovoracaceae bacterium]